MVEMKTQELTNLCSFKTMTSGFALHKHQLPQHLKSIYKGTKHSVVSVSFHSLLLEERYRDGGNPLLFLCVHDMFYGCS